ncbi:MAG: hypothetical protein KKB51_17625 [Candidatus Riflebacteria bacterium]|nr:hypothetical protein [Candidatus Riflebacteria bacterium]
MQVHQKSGFFRRMTAYFLVVSCFVLIASYTASGGVETISEFPESILLKTPTETFTHKFFFALRDERIWVRSRTDQDEKGRWHLLNDTGLPSKSPGKASFGVSSIKAIAADGDNLIAVSDNNVVYYTKTFNWKWSDHFSAIPLTKKLIMPENKRAFGISHRGNYMKYFLDIDGNPHSNSVCVTTLFMLADNGHMIYFADPWLPPAFSHIIDTPEKGTFIASNMSVSGSTIFLINRAGEMFTRLYDFDSSGQDPLLPYSYKRELRQEKRRNRILNLPPEDQRPNMDLVGGIAEIITFSLPPEDWRRQPDIPGQITDLITIFQTGEGNSSFELRVEGLDSEGRTGYYQKSIFEKGWNFVETGMPLKGRSISRNTSKADLYCPPKTRNFKGFIQRGGKRVSAQLLDFWPFSPPALLRFSIGKQTFDAKLHMRLYNPRKDGTLACAATVELPVELQNSTVPEIKQIYEKVFRKSPLIDMVLVVKKGVVQAVEDLHLVGLTELADTVTSLMRLKGLKGELQSGFHTRLRLIFAR